MDVSVGCLVQATISLWQICIRPRFVPCIPLCLITGVVLLAGVFGRPAMGPTGPFGCVVGQGVGGGFRGILGVVFDGSKALLGVSFVIRGRLVGV